MTKAQKEKDDTRPKGITLVLGTTISSAEFAKAISNAKKVTVGDIRY